MKLNKKIIIPALTLLAGASLAGSVTGTIAWYQYSTRTNVSYIGSSAGTIGNLQVRIAGAAGEAGEFGPQLSISDVANYLSSEDIADTIAPVTPGALGKNGSLKGHTWVLVADFTAGTEDPTVDTGHEYYVNTATNKLFTYANSAWDAGVALAHGATNPDANGVDVNAFFYNESNEGKLYKAVLADKDFYLNPQYGIASYEHWIKASDHYVVRLPLQLQFIGKDEQDLKAKDVYLSKLVIQADHNNAGHGDISDAIRVHLSAYTDDPEDAVNHLISKNGGTTLTHGKLKLGRGDDFDRAYDDEFGFSSQDYNYVNYGGDSGEQVCYGAIEDENPSAKYYEEEGLWNRIFDMASGIVAPDDGDGENGDLYFDSVANKLYKKEAGAWAEKQFVSGAADPDLDTDNDGKDYYRNSANGRFFLYVPAHNEAIAPSLVQRVDNSLEIQKLTADKKIGTTVVSKDPSDPNPQQYLNVDVTIWVEGWHKFNRNGSYTSIWDSNLIGANFDVGFQFAVNDR